MRVHSCKEHLSILWVSLRFAIKTPRSMHSTRGSAYADWHQLVPTCSERWCTEANKATQTDCYNSVAPAYPVWAYYAQGRQRRCQEDRVSLPSGRLEKITRLSPHHVAQHHPAGSDTTPPYAPQSSKFVSEPPSVEDDVDVWHYATQELHARNDDDDWHCRMADVLLRVFAEGDEAQALDTSPMFAARPVGEGMTTADTEVPLDKADADNRYSLTQLSGHFLPLTSTWPYLRCDVGLEEGGYLKNCRCVTVLCTNIETSYFTQLKICYLMTTFRCPSDILITSWLRRDQDVRRTSKRCH